MVWKILIMPVSSHESGETPQGARLECEYRILDGDRLIYKTERQPKSGIHQQSLLVGHAGGRNSWGAWKVNVEGEGSFMAEWKVNLEAGGGFVAEAPTREALLKLLYDSEERAMAAYRNGGGTRGASSFNLPRAYSDCVAKLEELIKLDKERLAREAEQQKHQAEEKSKEQEDRAQEEMAKIQELASSGNAIVEVLKRQVEVAVADVKDIQSKASLLGTAEVNAASMRAVEAEIEIRTQLGLATAVIDSIKEQSNRATKSVKNLEEQMQEDAANTAAVEKYADAVSRAGKTAKENFDKITTVRGGITKQALIITEIKRQITVATRPPEAPIPKDPVPEPVRSENIQEEKSKLEEQLKEKDIQSRPAEPKAPLEKALGELQISLAISHSDLMRGAIVGGGAYGIVYQGTYKKHQVAIKELRITTMSKEAAVDFRKEAELMMRLRHTNIVPLYGICTEPGHYCMVMQYFPNLSLYDVLHSESILSWERRIDIALGIAQGVRFLHHNNPEIIHCDLKSKNVLLDCDFHPAIGDFGFAKVKTESRTTSSVYGSAKGTFSWMAPELLCGEITGEDGSPVRYSSASDIYALAIIFWELATRKDPYQEYRIPYLLIGAVCKGKRNDIPPAPECPSRYGRLIERCWAQRIEDRPKIGEVVQELEACRKEMPA